jgi:hypothetical protein
MPKRTVELPCYFEFTADDRRELAFTLVPEQMEDHSFGLLQEGAIDFHRSWTGYHIYGLPLQQEGTRSPRPGLSSTTGPDSTAATRMASGNRRW